MGRALELGLVARTLRIATGVGRYWTARSGETEGRRWLDQALAAGPVENRERAAGYFWAGLLAFVQGDLVAAAESFAAATRAAQAAGEAFLEALSCGYLGFVAHEGGNDAAALAPHEQSRALLAQLTDSWERSEVLVSLSGIGDATLMEEIVALKREAGDMIVISDCLNNVGWEALARGDFDRASANLEEAVARARELDDTYRITLATGNLGLVAVLQERYTEAVEQLREPLLLCVRRGDRRCGSEAVLGLAAAFAGLGEDELSVKLDAIRLALMADGGLVYEAWMLERLDPSLELARTRLGPERVTALEAEVGPATLEMALELLDGSQKRSVASANQ